MGEGVLRCSLSLSPKVPSSATYKPCMSITSCPHRTHLCQYICLISTHYNQQCEHKLWYTYILHEWHMPLNKHACHTIHMCSNVLILQPTHRPYITANVINQNNKLLLCKAVLLVSYFIYLSRVSILCSCIMFTASHNHSS